MTADNVIEWNKPASVEQVLKVYEGFDQRLLDMVRIADPASLKVWKLVDMEVLPTWTNGRVALIGDAAHPFLPRESTVILLFQKKKN